MKKLGYVANFLYLYSMKEYDIQDKLRAEIAVLEEKVRHQQERILYLERMLYGSKREKRSKQMDLSGPTLFDDEFQEAVERKEAEIEKTVKEIKAESERRRTKSKEKPSRPAKYQYYGLREEEEIKDPENIDLTEYDRVGEDITRILHRKPAEIWVEVIKRPIYRHKKDGTFVQATAPTPVIGGNHVAGDLLSQMVIDKFVYHIPEYRQVKQYADMGVTLPTSTVNDWIHAVASKLYPLYESLCEDIRSRGYLQIDEVPWRIADRPDKCRKGYAWQFLDATPDSHGLYFYYLKGSRAGEIPRAQLKGYQGAIQTDGYGVYDYFEDIEGVTLLSCMAHVRRKFIEAQNSHPQAAAQALEYISLLYELESNLKERGATREEIATERQSKAIPIMDTMEIWMQAISTQCTPKDLLGKALEYAYKLWPRLKRYALDGIYRIDNNPVERGQRPSVMGRKNYLFSKNDRGAEDNAVFYSLLESCDVVGVNPLEWLTYTLNNLHDDSTEEEIKSLLPYEYKKSQAD